MKKPKDNLLVLVKKDWSPIEGEGKVKFKDYEEASKKARELAPKIDGIILTSEKGLYLKGLQDKGYHYEITDMKKGEISLLSPNNKPEGSRIYVHKDKICCTDTN